MKKLRHAPTAGCPCDSGLTYAECCSRWHAGMQPEAGVQPAYATTPEALMRSRYSAYVLGLLDYLLATWHGSTPPGDLHLQPVRWLGLEVRHAAATQDAGVVEFVARCRNNQGQAERMHEISRFVREGGRWYYVDGQAPADGE